MGELAALTRHQREDRERHHAVYRDMAEHKYKASHVKEKKITESRTIEKSYNTFKLRIFLEHYSFASFRDVLSVGKKVLSNMFLSVPMSSTCLSTVLTHANLTMYQTGIADVLLHQPSVLPSINPLQNSPHIHKLQSLSRSELNETCQLLDDFLINLNFPLLSSIRIGQGEGAVSKREFDNREDYDPTSLTPLRDIEYLSDNQSDSGMFGFSSLGSPESGSGESDPEFSYPLISKVHIKTEKGETRVKRPRGRPPKVSRELSSSVYECPKKNKHVPRGTHLWEFIRDILIHPERNQGLMKWEDRREGVFKFLKSEAVAQMWGQKKKNSSMTYEKLSRAMRYYYKREILERVDGRRLVYKFGKNSSGWKIEEIGMGILLMLPPCKPFVTLVAKRVESIDLGEVQPDF
ncbi:hypothetical protein F2P81_013150 [Scophthalmus maximus]|uniref:ETS domain-containing protein n=1 Tax=Scophthalmus maximus TaxID=52904 RepID=A0A6A4SZE8_SCOMX|nr:hypothetical protein F2P81_013150 [Scophthalmus maximus]